MPQPHGGNTGPVIEDMGQYPGLLAGLAASSLEERIPRARHLCQTDLYFLLRYVLGRADVENPWIFARCREVQADPDGMLDLWAREHYKSTIITYALTIQDILNDPEITVGIFSHTRPIAKGFLRQIKREFEANQQLRTWFPEILWDACSVGDHDELAVTQAEFHGLILRCHQPKSPSSARPVKLIT